MWENIIEYEVYDLLQKKLNQWRHKYNFKVKSITPCPHKKEYVFCYLARREKPTK